MYKFIEKHAESLLIFVCLNMFIATVWYVIELLTLNEIQGSGEDTLICLALSLVLTFIIRNKKIKTFLNNKNRQEGAN